MTAELIDGLVGPWLADPDADGVIAAAPVTDTIKRPPPRRHRNVHWPIG